MSSNDDGGTVEVKGNVGGFKLLRGNPEKMRSAFFNVQGIPRMVRGQVR